MSRVDTAELRRLHEAATKGENWQEAAMFNEACKLSLPALLDELEALREEVAALCTEHNATVDERDALAADNERLRKAIKACQKDIEGCAIERLDWAKQMREALAATPAQSLAAHEAALLREVMNLIRQTTPDPVDGVPESFGAHQGRMYAMEQIGAEADRIEKEAPHA